MSIAAFVLSFAVIALTCALMYVPAIARPAASWTIVLLDAIRRRPGRAAMIVGVAWLCWIGLAIRRDDRTLIPHSHDEQSYLLQARIFASGHLWLPTPTTPDCFDTFHVLVRPVYASKYPPGTALLHAPALAVGLPWWVTSIAMSVAAIATIAYVGVRLVGSWALPVIVVAAFTGGHFLTISIEPYSQPPLLLTAGIVWCVALAERTRHRLAWFAIAGLVGGLAFLIRPLDAILLLTAPAIGMLIAAWRARRSLGVALALGCNLLAFAPSAAFLLYMNHGLTGSAFRTPWALYAEQYQPGEHVGFGKPEVGTLPANVPQQKVDFYERYTKPVLLQHNLVQSLNTWWPVPGSRGAVFLAVVCGPPVLLLLVPLALLGAWRRRLFALATSVVLMLGLYTAYAFGGWNYYFPVVPLLWIAAAGGLDALLRDRNATLRGGVMLGLALLLVVSQLPLSANADSRTSEWSFEEMRYIAREVMPKIQTPAIVFLHYRAGDSYHNEPVYNLDAADPTAGPIVRAHWLGARNAELLQSLADKRRDSNVYVYDRTAGRLFAVGTVASALKTTPTSRPTTRP